MLNKIKLSIWRRLSQTGIGFILTNSYFQVFTTRLIYDGPLKSLCVPFLNCHACPMAVFSCPIGMLQQFMALHQFPFFLLGFFLVIGALVGRATCGWLCPFGLIQDLLYKFRTRKYSIPKYLNYGKYVVLVVLVLIIPYFTYQHWFSRLCPFGALLAGIPWVSWNPIDPDIEATIIDSASIGGPFYLKMTLLALFLVWFVLAKRPFCRVICPLGAIWAVFNRISLLRLKVAPGCPQCDQCSTRCPMDLNVNRDVDSENCIKCLECTACKHVHASLKF